MPMRDILTALSERAAEGRGDIFCHFRSRGAETVITSADLLAQAGRFARMLDAAGVESGAHVAIILKHSPDLYAAFLGCMLRRCVPSFLAFPSSKQDPAVYWPSHQMLFVQSGISRVITFAENEPLISRFCPGVQVLTPDDLPDTEGLLEIPQASPDAIAFVQYSSGTTSLKKGVSLSFDAVSQQVERYAEALRLRPDDVIVSWLPLYHDMGLIACFLLPLLTGTPIVSLDAFEWVAEPMSLFDVIEAHRGTLTWLPNFAFHHLIRTIPPDERRDLSGMRAFIDCSEPCQAATFDLFVSHFAASGVGRRQLAVCYAMAETVFAVSQTPIGEAVEALALDAEALSRSGIVFAAPGSTTPSRRLLSAGRPIRDAQVRIVGQDGRVLAGDLVGEISIKAPFMFDGYHCRPDLTAEHLRGGWHHTGDLGFLHGGQLYVLGRKDDLLILNGRNIYAHDVELALNRSVAGIKAGRCIALGVADETVGSQELVIVAEMDSREGGVDRLAARAVRKAILDNFGFLPKEVKLVDQGWLVKTTSGKISRAQNLSKYMSQRTVESTS